jgi:hypothetical protein
VVRTQPDPHFIPDARWGAFLLFILVTCSCLLLAGRAAAFSDDRASEIVTVEGRRTPAALGTRVDHLALYAAHSGVLQPIPFQVDERDAEGEIVLPNGPEARVDESPGVLDENDLIVFVAGDAGERFPGAPGTEVAVRDSDSGKTAWVYLRAHDAIAPRATRDDVDYDPRSDSIYGARYTVRFGQSVPWYFAFADGKHRDGVNLLDRLKARVEARILWGLFTFRRDENDVRMTTVAYKDGPVRVIRRERIEVHIGYGLDSPSIVADDFYTADAVEGPVIVRLPFSLRYVFADLTVRIYLDFRSLPGYSVVAGGLPQPLPVDCSHPAELEISQDSGPSWFALRGPAGTLMHLLRVGPTLDGLHRALYYRVDPGGSDSPESQPGLCPGIGYTLTHWNGMGRGAHELGLVMRALPGATPGDERRLLASFVKPLDVEVTTQTASR